MVFQNQFALNIELTRLLPPVRWATNKAANAIMTRARDLRHSGSDIVVEEDLALVFGRCRISAALESSFRTIITKSASNVPLLESIILQGGPGPTVFRALQESPYFSMVVQLSLLVWAFRPSYLATAIADSLWKRSEGAPSSSGLQSTPDRNGILAVLNACESQTAAFNWNMMLNAVSNLLGYRSETAPIEFPTFVLQGLLDMLPMVQTLPDDRLIHIQIPVGEYLQSGTSALIVWAHHVLDLTVLVRSRGQNDSSRELRFGNPGSEQVFIEEVAEDDGASITLLDAHKENLLTMKNLPEDDSPLIGCIRRVPAKGWGNTLFKVFLDSCPAFRPNNKAIIEDMQLVTCSFAFIAANHLAKNIGDPDKQMIGGETTITTAYNVDRRRLLEAARFLFDSPRISQGGIDRFIAQYSSKALDDQLPQPPSLAASLRVDLPETRRDWLLNDDWNKLCTYTRNVAVFLIALAHVLNLEECEDLFFPITDLNGLFEHKLVQQLDEWDGNDPLYIRDECWLQALAEPMVGYRSDFWNLPWQKICLISNGAWSAWIGTFANVDPADISAGSIWLGRGVPCRNGVRKVGIWDMAPGYFSFHGDPQKAEACGQTVSLRCCGKVTMGNPLVGEGEDVFLVCVRLYVEESPSKRRSVQRVGYKEFQTYLWKAQFSSRCSHAVRAHEQIKLGAGIATIAGFGNYLYETEERILLYLTAHSTSARWLALAWIEYTSIITDEEEEEEETGRRQILLRKNDCCLQCTIDQAAAHPGKWFIIL